MEEKHKPRWDEPGYQVETEAEPKTERVPVTVAQGPKPGPAAAPEPDAALEPPAEGQDACAGECLQCDRDVETPAVPACGVDPRLVMTDAEAARVLGCARAAVADYVTSGRLKRPEGERCEGCTHNRLVLRSDVKRLRRERATNRRRREAKAAGNVPA